MRGYSSDVRPLCCPLSIPVSRFCLEGKERELKMPENKTAVRDKSSKPAWYQTIRKYEAPSILKAVWQLVDTFIPYMGLLVMMHRSIQAGLPYWVTLVLAVPAGLLLGRIFIFFHDCVHSSFFASRRANVILGTICGILTFTAYGDWRRVHGVHHATAGNLDRRGTGDVWLLTVDEYVAASKLKRLRYRLFRHPLVLFLLGPIYVFLIAHRFPHKGTGRSERFSVYFTNLAILVILLSASSTIGLLTYVQIQLPVLLLCGAMAVWVFYVQHQFEGVYWARQSDWDPIRVGMEGSSYYKLPKVLQWLTGNIGFHHIHHIRPRIPNYNLQQCCDETPDLQIVHPLTIRKSLRSVFLKLWDEKQKEIVGFDSAWRAARG